MGSSVGFTDKNSALIKSPIINKITLVWVRLMVFHQLFGLINKREGNFFKTFLAIRDIKKRYELVFGETFLSKVAKVNNRYFWRLAAPGFPSLASLKMQKVEVDRFYLKKHIYGLRSLVFAITKKCPLNCRHCFEWPNLNRPEKLCTDDLIGVVQKYQEFGTTQIMLSGGEPMTRLDDIIQILENAKPWTDFWIITSGYGVTMQNAVKLYEKGLTGLMVSIDDYNAEMHNAFRGSSKSFDWAVEAVQNARKAGLVVTLSLCVTRAFVKKENLDKYMVFARELGASFVQIIEPRATGRWEDQDIALTQEQQMLLEEIYHRYNSHKDYRSFPIINYLGYHQRKIGCFGSGDRFFYIDTDGDAHICPYCNSKIANAVELSAEEMIGRLSSNPCHIFKNNGVLS